MRPKLAGCRITSSAWRRESRSWRPGAAVIRCHVRPPPCIQSCNVGDGRAMPCRAVAVTMHLLDSPHLVGCGRHTRKTDAAANPPLRCDGVWWLTDTSLVAPRYGTGFLRSRPQLLQSAVRKRYIPASSCLKRLQVPLCEIPAKWARSGGTRPSLHFSVYCSGEYNCGLVIHLRVFGRTNI